MIVFSDSGDLNRVPKTLKKLVLVYFGFLTLYYGSVAARNFVRAGPEPDVRPTVPSLCFRTVEIDIKHQRKILASLFRGGMASSASFWLRCCVTEYISLNYCV